MADSSSPQTKKLRTSENDEASFVLSPEFLRLIFRVKVDAVRTQAKRIFTCTRSDSVVAVWEGMIKQNISSVPVLQKTKNLYFGYLDIADIVGYFVNFFGEAQLKDSKDFWALVNRTEEFRSKKVKDVMSFPLSRRNPFRPVYSGYSLFSALEILAREPGLHRVPVIDREQHLINIITQSQLVSIVEQHLEIMGTLKDLPLSHIPTVWTKVLSVKETDTAMSAFNLMAEHHVSGVAVLDDSGDLVSNLSLRDLKQVSADASMFWRLFQDVKSFIRHIKDTEAKTKSAVAPRPASIVTATGKTTLGEAISLLEEHCIHRLYVLDSSTGKLAGVVSLKTILERIIDSPAE
mmetsp:Transcript_39831/g.100403  ORF Transcript_39831/g.100403 Transcript_39831/m.100403 type:complete len:348 (+) Transcript_39831:112-1155(+)|eukprot:CAMPEP_0177653538 /NCGR_PEP_ID=MMETSP0447-20121125/13792_1 /TAXON_ID=0 /ORGANISM="Stygamoeba regulata, Strain BSH-02190019" /LENGTH=347 /DNA_ID=CAMNT_0019157007 /DNA_START=99 /DNA_END=1142 /DNA_ORIENTATION=-